MMTLLTEPVVEQLGWMLLHTLWQFAAIAALVWLCERALAGRSSAAIRYWLGVCCLAALTIAPAMTWTMLSATHEPAATVATTRESSGILAQATRGDERRGERFLTQAEPRGWETLIPWSRSLLPVVVSCWLGGMAICSLRLFLGWYTLRRLRTVGVSAVAEQVTEMTNKLALRLRMRPLVTVLNSTLTKTPLVVGYVRPVLLLPLELVTQLRVVELESILAHELAHIRRHDFLVNLWQVLLETIFFYHPAVWIISRRLRAERENCCDDLALSIVGDPVGYGRALLHVEELRGAAPLLVMGANGGSLHTRIQRLFEQSSSSKNSAGLLSGVILPSLILITVIVCCTWGAMPWALAGQPATGTNQPSGSAAKDEDSFAEVLGRLEAAAKAKSVGGTKVQLDPPQKEADGRRIVTATQVEPKSTTKYEMQFRQQENQWVCCGATSEETETGGAKYQHRIRGDAIEIDQLLIWLGWQNKES